MRQVQTGAPAGCNRELFWLRSPFRSGSDSPHKQPSQCVDAARRRGARRWRRTLCAATSVLATLLAMAAQAQHATEQAHDPGLLHSIANIGFIAKVTNFAAVVALLVWASRKPLLEFLKARRRFVQEGLAEAAKRKAEAEAVHREYTERLATLDEELQRTRIEMTRSNEREKHKILEEAQKTADKLRRDTEAMIEQQMNLLRSGIQREVVEQAVKAAGDLLRQQIGQGDQQRFAQDYLQALGRLAAATQPYEDDRELRRPAQDPAQALDQRSGAEPSHEERPS